MTDLSVFLIACGAVFLVWFTAPFLRWRICNVGNLLGGAVSLAVLLCGVFYKRLVAFIVQLCQTISVRILVGACLVAIAACILFALVVAVQTVRCARRTPPQNAVLLVLGCRVYGSRPSRLLRYRTECAAQYLKLHPHAVAVLSGGQGRDEAISEAACMYRMLTEAGIEPDRLLLESQSTSTKENIVFSKKVLQNHGFAERPVAVVTNSFHLLRACLMVKHCGLQAYGLAARSSILTFPTFFVRELLGLIKFFLLHK